MRIRTRSLALVIVPAAFLLPESSGQTLLWSEEFDYSGAPDPTIWSYDVGHNNGWGNNELQTYTPDQANVLVENGSLRITARKEDDMFSSARIKSDGKVTFTYGTLVARIKVPNMDAGLWPAFWTVGADFNQVGWPASGEVNIMEMGQGLAIDEGLVNKRVVSAAHWDIYGQYATYARSFDSEVDLSQDYHEFKLEWTDTQMTTYVDDNWIWEIDIGEACPSCAEFHQPHYIILNMAVGGGFTSGGTSSSTGSSCAGSSSSAGTTSSGGCPTRGPDNITAPLPANLWVDWVRLYDNGFTQIYTPAPKPTSTPAPSAKDRQPETLLPTQPPTKFPTAGPLTFIPANTQLPTVMPVTPMPITTNAPLTPIPIPIPVTPIPPVTPAPFTTNEPIIPVTQPPFLRQPGTTQPGSSTDGGSVTQPPFIRQPCTTQSGSSSSDGGSISGGGKGGQSGTGCGSATSGGGKSGTGSRSATSGGGKSGKSGGSYSRSATSGGGRGPKAKSKGVAGVGSRQGSRSKGKGRWSRSGITATAETDELECTSDEVTGAAENTELESASTATEGEIRSPDVTTAFTATFPPTSLPGTTRSTPLPTRIYSTTAPVQGGTDFEPIDDDKTSETQRPAPQSLVAQPFSGAFSTSPTYVLAIILPGLIALLLLADTHW